MNLLLKGKPVADEVYEQIKQKTVQLLADGCQLNLAVIVVAGDPASAYYVQAKRKVADRIGIGFQVHEFSAQGKERELLDCIDRLNKDASVHGIMLELPLPKHLSTRRVTESITPLKDVDGVTPANKLALLTGAPGLVPATPQACIRLVKHYGYKLEASNVTLIGRGQTVGMPLFHLLQREQATVTVCHSRTRDLQQHVARANIVFAAVGSPGLITREMIHGDLVLIDAGMNERPDGTIAGDVEPSAGEAAAAFTPTPGGIGTLTTALLFHNVLKAYELQIANMEQGASL